MTLILVNRGRVHLHSPELAPVGVIPASKTGQFALPPMLSHAANYSEGEKVRISARWKA